MHCVDLPPHMAKVEVDNVLDLLVDLKLSKPPELGYELLGQCKGWFIQWPKAAIKMSGTSTRTSPSMTNTRTPSPGPPPLGLCQAPLLFGDLDANHGGEHDMLVMEPHDQEPENEDPPPPT